MGELLTFKKRESAIARTPVEGGAQIMFFMGVRYERHAEPALETSKAIAVSKRGVGKTRGGGKRRA